MKPACRLIGPEGTRIRGLGRILGLLALSAGCASSARTQPEFFAPPSGPDAPYSEAVRAGAWLFLAGKLGIDPATGALPPGGIQPETRQALANIQTVLERHDGTLDGVVKCTVFLADMSEWAAMNEVYTEFFPTHRPARSAVGVAGLGRDARVEIECLVYLGSSGPAPRNAFSSAAEHRSFAREPRLEGPEGTASPDRWSTPFSGPASCEGVHFARYP